MVHWTSVGTCELEGLWGNEETNSIASGMGECSAAVAYRLVRTIGQSTSIGLPAGDGNAVQHTGCVDDKLLINMESLPCHAHLRLVRSGVIRFWVKHAIRRVRDLRLHGSLVLWSFCICRPATRSTENRRSGSAIGRDGKMTLAYPSTRLSSPCLCCPAQRRKRHEVRTSFARNTYRRYLSSANPVRASRRTVAMIRCKARTRPNSHCYRDPRRSFLLMGLAIVIHS